MQLSTLGIDLGFDLIYEFDKKYSLKTDIRNSVYDILILATAIENNAVFITKASVLNRFAAEYLGINISKRSDYIEIPFVNLSEKQEKKNRESKEYINRGWQVRIRNTQGFF